MSDKRVIIVGAGVAGLSTAYFCRQMGYEVTVLERETVGHSNCSTGNAGMLVPSHFVPLAAPGVVGQGLRMMLSSSSPFSFALRADRGLAHWAWLFWKNSKQSIVDQHSPAVAAANLASKRLYEQFEEVLPDFGLTRRGLLMLCKTEKALAHEAKLVPRARSLGLEANLLGPEELRKVDPDIEMDVLGGVHFVDDCHLLPERFMSGLRAELVRMGVEIQHECDILGWRIQDQTVQAALSSSGEIEGDVFVITAGSWSAGMCKGLKIDLPLAPGKGYSLTVPRPAQLPQLCSILLEARVAVTPMGYSLRFAGTMELGNDSSKPNMKRVAGITRAIPTYFPRFRETDFKDLPVWSGFRPCSPDGMPYIGPLRRYDNLWVGTGTGMMGMSLGPITGKLLAQALSGDVPDLQLDPFDPNRFNL